MKKIYKLEGLGCAACAAKIEKAIMKLDGVSSASVSFLTNKMAIEGDIINEETEAAAIRSVHKYEPSVKVTLIK